MSPTTRYEYKKLAYSSVHRWVKEDGRPRPHRPDRQEERDRYEIEFWERTQELGRDWWELIRTEYLMEGAREGLFLFERELVPASRSADTDMAETEQRVIGQAGDVRMPRSRRAAPPGARCRAARSKRSPR